MTIKELRDAVDSLGPMRVPDARTKILDILLGIIDHFEELERKKLGTMNKSVSEINKISGKSLSDEIESIAKQSVSLVAIAMYFESAFYQAAESYDTQSNEVRKEEFIDYEIGLAYKFAQRVMNHPVVKRDKDKIEKSIKKADEIR